MGSPVGPLAICQSHFESHLMTPQHVFMPVCIEGQKCGHSYFIFSFTATITF